METKSFRIWTEPVRSIITKLSGEQSKKLLLDLLDFVDKGIEPDDLLSSIALAPIIEQVRRTTENSKVYKENGALGGRPITGNNRNKPKITVNNQNKPHKPSVSVSDSVSNPVKEEVYRFIENRIFLKNPMSQNAVDLFCNKLNKYFLTDDDKIEAIHNAIESGWKSVYKPSLPAISETKKVAPPSQYVVYDDDDKPILDPDEARAYLEQQAFRNKAEELI